MATLHLWTSPHQRRDNVCSVRMIRIQASHSPQSLVVTATSHAPALDPVYPLSSHLAPAMIAITLASQSATRNMIQDPLYNLQVSNLAGQILLLRLRMLGLQSRTLFRPIHKDHQGRDQRRLIRWAYRQQKGRATVLLCDTRLLLHYVLRQDLTKSPSRSRLELDSMVLIKKTGMKISHLLPRHAHRLAVENQCYRVETF